MNPSELLLSLSSPLPEFRLLRVISPAMPDERRIQGIFQNIRVHPEYRLSRSNPAYLDILSHMNEESQTEMVKLIILSLFGLVSHVARTGGRKRGRDGQRLSSLMSPHESRAERISRLSKSALCSALVRRMEREGSATYRDLQAYRRCTETSFSSRAVCHLNFRGCDDEVGARLATQGMVHVQSIDLTNSFISNHLLHTIAIYSRGLQRLNLSGCGAAITEEGIVHVVRHCPRLRDLDFSNLELLSNTGLRWIVERLGEDLERLILRGCHPYQRYIRPETIRAIGQRCPNMEELTLPFECPGLTDAVIDELCMECPGLRALILSGGIQTLITEDVMASFASHCADLEVLDVRQASDTPPSRRMGRLGISLVAQNCLSLRSIQYGPLGQSQELSNREAIEKEFLS